MSNANLAECQATGQVEGLMTPKPITVHPGTPIGEISEIMTHRRIRHLPVVEEDESLCGIISQRDLLKFRRAQAGGEASEAKTAGPGEADWGDACARDLMSPTVDTVSPSCCGGEAARQMLKSKRSSLPVVDTDGRVIGILTEADFLRLAAREWPRCSCGGVVSANDRLSVSPERVVCRPRGSRSAFARTMSPR